MRLPDENLESLKPTGWAGRAELVLLKRRLRKGTGVSDCFFDGRLTWFSDKQIESEDFV